MLQLMAGQTFAVIMIRNVNFLIRNKTASLKPSLALRWNVLGLVQQILSSDFVWGSNQSVAPLLCRQNNTRNIVQLCRPLILTDKSLSRQALLLNEKPRF